MSINIRFTLTGILGFILLLGAFTFLFAFISKRKHLLGTLLRLEGLILVLMFILYMFSRAYIFFHNFVLIFLTLAACEGALGLSLLVCVIRSYGRDNFNSLNFLQC